MPCLEIRSVSLLATHLKVFLSLRRLPQRGHVIEGVVVAERLDLNHLAKPLQRPPERMRGRGLLALATARGSGPVKNTAL